MAAGLLIGLAIVLLVLFCYYLGTRTSSGGTMPDFRQSIKAQLQKTKDEMPQGLMREVMETYKPHILSRRRQLIEDCVRDLRLNNDHIHIIEQEMRKAIQVK